MLKATQTPTMAILNTRSRAASKSETRMAHAVYPAGMSPVWQTRKPTYSHEACEAKGWQP